MKKMFIILTGIFILIILILNFSLSKKTPSVTINGKTFYVDVAKSDSEHEKGLSVYNKIPEDKGMIFIFKKPGYYAFWMKDMKFAIDIIYIRNNKIVDIFQNVSPPKSSYDNLKIIKPKEKSDTVLEINANLSNKYNFKKGNLVKINI
ncbi:MAG: DUF192 domain-containing protein [Patescibacteria group bacterium]|nr:DUF192 domain-containing protein [Patescibacteria group bacterium]